MIAPIAIHVCQHCSILNRLLTRNQQKLEQLKATHQGIDIRTLCHVG